MAEIINISRGVYEMGYVIDLSKISTLTYMDIIKNQRLLPARQILKQSIDRNFDIIIGLGLTSVDDIRKALSSKQKIEQFSDKTGISIDYLTILKREICSVVQKPVKLSDFPDVDANIIKQFNDSGIITTKDYYDIYMTLCDINAQKLHIDQHTAHELLCLCNLTRINGVGAVAARAFYEAGYETIQDVADADAAKMLDDVTKINAEKTYYRAKLGQKDMQFCIDFANLLLNYGE